MARTARIRRRGTRFIRYSLIAAMALTGCDDGTSTRTPPTDGPGDQPAVAGLSLDETQIAAVLGERDLNVRLSLHRTRAGQAAGTVHVQLERLGDEAVLAQAEVPFTADAADVPVDLSMALPEGLDAADPSAPASYVLRYRVEWDGAPIWGRRSLFAAVQLAETQLLANDTFQVDVPSYLRLLTRDPRTGAALGDLPVTVSLIQVNSDPVLLYTGKTDAFGELAAAIR
ncbi:MAG: hypothetical protein R3F43_23710, partial [bacterium]